MGTIDLYSKINKKYSIRLNRVLACKKFYISMYRAYMMELYDLGFIGDPTIFNKKELFSNISDLDIRGMFTVSGEISLTISQVRYAIYKNKDNEDALQFLKRLELVLKYRQFSESVDKLYETYEIAGTATTRTNFGLRNRNRYNYSKDGIGLDEAIFECTLKEDEEIVSFSINNGIWGLAMRELNIPEDMWLEDGLFDADLTHAEEVECASILLDGKVKPSGKCRDVLEEWLFEHKWSEQRFSINSIGLYNYLLNIKVGDIDNLREELYKSLEEKEIPVVFYNDGFMFGVMKKTFTTVPVGQFQILQLEEDEIIGNERNALEGYTGEAYAVSYLDKEGICYIGCPIELYVTDKTTDFFIDMEQTEINKYKTWFEVNGASVGFEEGSIRPTNTASFTNNLYNVYFNSKLGQTIGYLEGVYSSKEMEQAKKEVYSYIKN